MIIISLKDIIADLLVAHERVLLPFLGSEGVRGQWAPSFLVYKNFSFVVHKLLQRPDGMLDIRVLVHYCRYRVCMGAPDFDYPLSLPKLATTPTNSSALTISVLPYTTLLFTPPWP